jgi:uncharacterized RDD family membrane protein YckC
LIGCGARLTDDKSGLGKDELERLYIGIGICSLVLLAVTLAYYLSLLLDLFCNSGVPLLRATGRPSKPQITFLSLVGIKLITYSSLSILVQQTQHCERREIMT